MLYYIAQVAMMGIYYKGWHGVRRAGTWVYQTGLSTCGYEPVPSEDLLWPGQGNWINGANMANRVYEHETETRQVPKVPPTVPEPGPRAFEACPCESTKVPESPDFGGNKWYGKHNVGSAGRLRTYRNECEAEYNRVATGNPVQGLPAFPKPERGKGFGPDDTFTGMRDPKNIEKLHQYVSEIRRFSELRMHCSSRH